MESTIRSAITLHRSMVEVCQSLYPEIGAEGLEIAGGYASLLGANGPLTQAGGMGVFQPMLEADFDQMDAFYRERKSRIQFKLSPLADAETASTAVRRATRVEEFEQTLARSLSDLPLGPETSDVLIRPAQASEDLIYTMAVKEGFVGVGPEMDGFDKIFQIIFHDPYVRSFLAIVDGEVAGGGAVGVADGIAWLQGASVKERFRGRGIHKSLIDARLRFAQDSGCHTICVGALPAGISQVNMQKMGFQVALTKISLEWD